MKICSFSQFLGAGVIAASLAVVPLTIPAQAQTQDSAPNTYDRSTEDVNRVDNYDDYDWGWLGLLGLTGLAGLLGRNRRETVSSRPTNEREVGVHSSSDYRR